jgi:hypothetical protein
LDGLLSRRGRMKTVNHSRKLRRMDNPRPRAKD